MSLIHVISNKKKQTASPEAINVTVKQIQIDLNQGELTIVVLYYGALSNSDYMPTYTVYRVYRVSQND